MFLFRYIEFFRILIIEHWNMVILVHFLYIITSGLSSRSLTILESDLLLAVCWRGVICSTDPFFVGQMLLRGASDPLPAIDMLIEVLHEVNLSKETKGFRSVVLTAGNWTYNFKFKL